MTSTAAGVPGILDVGDGRRPGVRRTHRVTAVVVAHDGARWLPRLLSALADSTRPPDHVVAVDTGSRDETAQLLADSAVVDDVVTLAADTGFAAAVAAGAASVIDLTDAPATIDLRDGVQRPTSDTEVEWLWVLHDDCAPRPDALGALLHRADLFPAAGIIGPKLRGWKRSEVLQECGLALSGAGRPETGVTSGDVDQGQLDGRTEVMAVSSAGMLVRRDVWDRLRGFSPAFGDEGADTDLCWRAIRSGYPVVVAPGAVVHHRRAGASAARQPTGRRGTDRYRHRRTAVTTALVHAPLWRLPFTALRAALGGILRFLLGLVTLAPRQAWDDLTATAVALLSWRRIGSGRRAVARTAEIPDSDLRHLRPSVGQRVARLSELVARPTNGTTGPGLGARAVPLARPLAVVAGVLIAVCLIASWELWFGSGRIAGGALLPAPDSGIDLFSSFVAPWHEVGLGSDSPAPPYLALLAAVSVLVLGSATIAVQLVLLAAPVLAGVSMMLALRGVVRRPVLVAAGLAYALLPAIPAAVDTGRLGSAGAAILLPVVARLVVRVTGLAADVLPPATRRTAVAAALAVAALGAFVPALAITVLVVAVAACLATRRAGPAWRLALIAAAVVALLWPWSAALLADPARLLLEIGAHPERLAAESAEVWQFALFSPGGPAAAPAALAGVLAVLAVLALAPGRTRKAVVNSWLVILAGLVLAIVQSLVTVAVPWSGQPVSPWPGPGTLLMGLGAVVAVAIAVSGWQMDRLMGRVAVVAFVITPVLIGGWWIAQGQSIVKRDEPLVVSPFVSVASIGPEAPRSLALQQGADGAVSYQLLSGVGPRLGDADVAPPAQTMAAFDSAVSRMTAGSGDALAELAGAAVRFVTVEVDRDRALARQLDAVPGLRRVSTVQGQGLWEVVAPSARVRAATAQGAAPIAADATGSALSAAGALPAGATTVQVAETPSPLWRATVAGAPLASSPDVWQTFPVPEDGVGEIAVWVDPFPRLLTLAVPGLALLVLLGVAMRSGRPARKGATA